MLANPNLCNRFALLDKLWGSYAVDARHDACLNCCAAQYKSSNSFREFVIEDLKRHEAIRPAPTEAPRHADEGRPWQLGYLSSRRWQL